MKDQYQDRLFFKLNFFFFLTLELIIQQYLFPCVMQPSVSGMDPPFGDAFQNYTFADQALTSTDLLANSSDPDFIYELVRLCRGFESH